jgi:hypothetical protein
MSREAHIPLVLWICAAIVAHYVGGKGANEAATVVQDSAELRALTRSVRAQLHPPDTTFEVLTEDAAPTADAKVASPEDAPGAPSEPALEPTEPDKKAKPIPSTDREKPKETAPVPPSAPKPKEAPKTPEAPAIVAPSPPPPPPPEMDRRIAIKQNVKKDQENNPNANRIADDANHTEEETVARIRSHDQDDPNPSPGTHAGPSAADPGNSDHDKVADSENKKGNEKHAPGEAKPSATDAEHNSPAPPGATAANSPPKGGLNSGREAGPKVAPAAPSPSPPSAGGAGPAAPEVISGDRGSYTLNPINPGGDGKSRTAGKKRTTMMFDNPVHPNATGFNKGGPFDLTSEAFETAVGKEQLKAERAADGAARRSAHRGASENNKFERWRSAIENYEPSVKLGNQTSLNAAQVPFATYINAIHNRLHPIFAEEFLAALDGLPKSHALNQELVTHIEIVLSRDQGRIVRIGVTRPSGVTAFDVVALSSVNRAQPFGKAPELIVSPDGNVYLHWEFHRDPFDACTTRNARPFLLKEAPTLKALPRAPAKKPPAGIRADDRPAVPGPLLPLRSQ